MMKESQRSMQESYNSMMDALARMQEHSAKLTTQMSQMEIKAGDVKVNMPSRAKSFRIEYDDITGQPERLIPEYDKVH